MSGHALVTGAGSGIGRDIALHLARRGHHVHVADLSLDSAAQVATEIEVAGSAATPHHLDVSDHASVATVIDAIADPIVVLVNNAGLQHVALLHDFGSENFRRLIDVMLTGTALVTAAALPAMRSAGSGRIINIGSIHSLVASPFKSAYVAAKHGLVGLTRVVALENADRDITVNLLCPAYVRTPLVEKQIAEQAREHGLSEDQVVAQIMLKPMPKGRFIETDEINGTIDFLCSRAARNITGQCIAIDGGWTAQ